jgi:aquaporin Z
MYPNYKMEKLIVEFIGTFALVYVVLATGNAYAIGATLALAILFGGAISGGAFNPAVAVGMWMAKKIKQSDLIPYILAQLLGGVAAYEFFRRMGAIRI